jgi:hypothetical protein
VARVQLRHQLVQRRAELRTRGDLCNGVRQVAGIGARGKKRRKKSSAGIRGAAWR